MTEWVFQKDNSGEFKGINANLTIFFKKDPYGSLGKEMLQNSMDEKRADEDGVILSFKLKEISQSETPGYNSFKQRFKACKNNDYESSESSKDWYDSAEKILNKNKVQILEIHDKNTNGMKGPCEPGSGFFAFMKSDGLSQKNQGTESGGSWGWGKNSIFNVSSIHAFFVSTKYLDDNEHEISLAMGKTVLATHTLDGSTFGHSGYYGKQSSDNHGVIPFNGHEEIPVDWLKREDIGTSIFAIGFKDEKDWERRLIGALIKTNFPAIYKKEAIIKIDNEVNNQHYQLSKATILGHMNDPSIQNAMKDQADRSANPDPFAMTKQFMMCMSESAIIEEIEDRKLGHFTLRIMVKDGFIGKSVCLIRNGMVIVDAIGNNKIPGLQRFGRCRNFAAIVEPKSKAGNDAIKSLEGPAHDGIYFEYVNDPRKAQELERDIRNLARKIKSRIERHAAFDTDGTNQMGFTNLFSTEGSAEKSVQRDPEGKIKFKLKPVKDSPPAPVYKEKGGSGGLGGGSTGSGGSGDGSGQGGEEDGKNARYTTKPTRDHRIIWRDADKLSVFFTSNEDLDNCELRIQAIGERQSDTDDISSVGSSHGEIDKDGNIVSLSFKRDKRIELELKIKEAHKYNSKALRVFAIKRENPSVNNI